MTLVFRPPFPWEAMGGRPRSCRQQGRATEPQQGGMA